MFRVTIISFQGNSITHFIYKLPYNFNRASLLLNFEFQMLFRCCLSCYNHNYAETNFVFIIFVSMRRPRSISIIVIYFPFTASFSLLLIIKFHFSKRTCFLQIFQNICYDFWMITQMKKANNFQIAKVQPRGVAQLSLDFFLISSWCCL